MNVGQVVKFREVIEAGDADLRFVVIEDRGDRVLVAATKATGQRDWTIAPTHCYPTAELVAAE
jgi:hypothetical protein